MVHSPYVVPMLMLSQAKLRRRVEFKNEGGGELVLVKEGGWRVSQPHAQAGRQQGNRQ